VRAFAERVPRDGEGLVLESDVAGDGAHMLAVFIADRLGGAASALALTRKLDLAGASSWGAGSGASNRLRLRPVYPVPARRRALEAIELTDDLPPAWIDENFADNRALAIARLTRLPLLTPARAGGSPDHCDGEMFQSAERVFPAQRAEAAKVGIGRVQRDAVFDCESRESGVRNQVPPYLVSVD
jgi:hypothetical protein